MSLGAAGLTRTQAHCFCFYMNRPDASHERRSKLPGWMTRAVEWAAGRIHKFRRLADPLSPRENKGSSLIPFVENFPVVRATLEGLKETTSRIGGGWWTRTLFVFIALPSLFFFLYSALIQTPGYEAEARVTVRGAQEFRGSTADASGIISRITGGGAGAKSTIQDAYIVLNYIKSSSIIIDLGGTKYLEKYYSSSGIDYFSRLREQASIEDLLKYWLARVSASVDTVSDVVTIKVEAFALADASAIARDVVRRSESLINTITERSRRDAVERAETEVSRSADRLSASTALRNLMNS